jgi:hypothetical protein
MDINHRKIAAGIAALIVGTLALNPAVDAYHSSLPCPAADDVPVCEILQDRSDSDGAGRAPSHPPLDTTDVGGGDAKDIGPIGNSCLRVLRTRIVACPD